MGYRWVQKDVGGTVYTDELFERADASPTFAVLSEDGGSLATGTATVDSVNTTLSSGVGDGAVSLSVTSATGIAVGRRYYLTAGEDAGGEVVTIAAISGTTLTLARPTLRAHASGAAFYSTRVSCVIPSSACTQVRRGCRVEIAYTVSAAARPVVSLEFDVTRYALRTGLTLEHVRDLDPSVVRKSAKGTVWPALFAMAWERIVSRIAQQKDPGGLVGALDLTQPHALAVLLLVAEQSSDADSIARAEQLRQRLDAELVAILASRAFDDDQDGAVEPHEGFYRTISITRG